MDEGELPADDFPDRAWLLLRVLPGNTPKAIRMRHVLKRLLRDHGLKCERLMPAGEGDELSTDQEP